MEALGIGFGSVLLFLVALYFVVKWAVKNGINESMLVTDKQREESQRETMEEIRKNMGEEAFRKLYDTKTEENQRGDQHEQP